MPWEGRAHVPLPRARRAPAGLDARPARGLARHRRRITTRLVSRTGGLRTRRDRTHRARASAPRARLRERAVLDLAAEAAERHGPAAAGRGTHPRHRLRIRAF